MDPSGASEGVCAVPVEDVAHNITNSELDQLLAELEKTRHGWRRIVTNFTPAWFSVTMGTGIASILLYGLPYNGDWLYWLSVIIFALNVFLFVLFTVISIIRYTLYPGIWSAMIRHPVQSLFLGTFPMGLATIINMMCKVCVPAWGSWVATFAWTLWWIDVVAALATNLYMPFIIMYKHETQLSKMTAAWLLPIVATIVSSATGGVLATVLPNPQHALWTVIISYILWGCGVPLAMFTLVMYFHRLTMHALPPREVIVSVFLPLGPLGQGAFAIMQLGKDALRIIPETGNVPLAPMAGQIAYVGGLLLGLIMWGFGLVWLFFAVASISRSKFPFNIGWWGFTFPLGVYSVATTTLALELPSLVFKVLGTIFSVAVVLLWMVVATGTAMKAWTGELFFAPCLDDWKRRLEEKRSNTLHV
ncbi:uncharacterized protein PV09_04970 [Verruconis gallopava]|uniref:Sulfite efflux pump SSU1 n=1 Tax=Verruconis gallopava TaxID=253628 RepID=A0A0D2ABH2_9PEZI|nr:uncharacterized protein PV09_04970 [Verruconis gallopava]KIW04163.1 hypothetical protein PV09_04970 [Verruconis gallopava]